MDHLWQFEAIGTSWRIRTARSLGELQSQVLTQIDQFDQVWSRFRPDSRVAELARGNSVDLGSAAPELLATYDWLDQLTAGAVNPLVGVSLAHLGYDQTYSLQPSAGYVTPPDWSSLSRAGSTVSPTEPVVLDIGAIGKGFLAAQVANFLAELGVENVVNAGGDIVNRSTGAIEVALEHPANPELAIGQVTVPAGHAICGSATNRRAWANGLHHVLDARTGRPTEAVSATWAVGPSALVAEALSIAAFFVAPVDLGEPDYQVLRFGADGQVNRDRWTGELFR